MTGLPSWLEGTEDTVTSGTPVTPTDKCFMTATIPLFFFQSKSAADLRAPGGGAASTDHQSVLELEAGVPTDKLICRLTGTARARKRLTPAPYFLKPRLSFPGPTSAHAPCVMRPFPADRLHGRGAAMAETDQTPGLGNRGRMGPAEGSVATPHSSRVPGRIRHTDVGSPAARRRLRLLESPACPPSARRLGPRLELDLRMPERHTQLDLQAAILRQTANGSGHS